MYAFLCTVGHMDNGNGDQMDNLRKDLLLMRNIYIERKMESDRFNLQRIK